MFACDLLISHSCCFLLSGCSPIWVTLGFCFLLFYSFHSRRGDLLDRSIQKNKEHLVLGSAFRALQIALSTGSIVSKCSFRVYFAPSSGERRFLIQCCYESVGQAGDLLGGLFSLTLRSILHFCLEVQCAIHCATEPCYPPLL